MPSWVKSSTRPRETNHPSKTEAALSASLAPGGDGFHFLLQPAVRVALRV